MMFFVVMTVTVSALRHGEDCLDPEIKEGSIVGQEPEAASLVEVGLPTCDDPYWLSGLKANNMECCSNQWDFFGLVAKCPYTRHTFSRVGSADRSSTAFRTWWRTWCKDPACHECANGCCCPTKETEKEECAGSSQWGFDCLSRGKEQREPVKPRVQAPVHKPEYASVHNYRETEADAKQRAQRAEATRAEEQERKRQEAFRAQQLKAEREEARQYRETQERMRDAEKERHRAAQARMRAAEKERVERDYREAQEWMRRNAGPRPQASTAQKAKSEDQVRQDREERVLKQKIREIHQMTSSEEQRKALKKLAFKWHPDRNLHQPEFAQRMFQLLPLGS